MGKSARSAPASYSYVVKKHILEPAKLAWETASASKQPQESSLRFCSNTHSSYFAPYYHSCRGLVLLKPDGWAEEAHQYRVRLKSVDVNFFANFSCKFRLQIANLACRTNFCNSKVSPLILFHPLKKTPWSLWILWSFRSSSLKSGPRICGSLLKS